MTSWTWDPTNADHNWFDAQNWSSDRPDTYPTISGTAYITTDVGPILSNTGTTPDELDGITVYLEGHGSHAAADPTLTGENFLFGPDFILNAQFAARSNFDIVGTVNYEGTIVAADALGQFALAVSGKSTEPDATFTLDAGGVIEITNRDSFLTRLGTDGLFVNNGLVDVAQGWFSEPEGGLAGTGTISLGSLSSARLGSVAAGQFIAMSGTGDSVHIGEPSLFYGTISDFGAGDVIALDDIVANAATYDAATSILTLTQNGQAVASLTVETTGTQNAFYVELGRSGALVTTSDSDFVWNGGTGDWFTAANWDDLSGNGGVPQPGDSIAIYSGTAIISADQAAIQSFEAETITLAASAGAAAAVLQADDATFGADTVIRDGASNSTGTLVALGTTMFEGTMLASAQTGSLTLNIGSDRDDAGADFLIANFQDGTPVTFLNPNSAGSLIATQKGVLNVTGSGTLDNEGIIQAQGAINIAPEVTVIGTAGTIQIMTGGVLTIGGSVSESIGFSDATGTLVLDDLAGASAANVWNFEQGNTIVLPNVTANGFSYDPGAKTLTLTDNGTEVGTLSIYTEDGEQHFKVSSDGSDGTTITYQQPDPLQQLMLPTAVFAEPGQAVSLESILESAFGNSSPYADYGLSYLGNAALSASNWSYWDPSDPSVSAWSVDGTTIAAVAPNAAGYPLFTATETVSSDAVSGVDYVAGNNIGPETYLKVPVTGDGASPTDNVYYAIMTIDPHVESPTADSGIVNPSDIVASALRFAAYYQAPMNDADCGYIAAAVAAAAGATMPYEAYSTDPDDNASGGFWRVVYRGSDQSDPVADWFNLVQPGDVVRMGFLGGGQHTTTILSKNADGTVTVYDNAANPTNADYSVISIHDATYWEDTIPASITIYRLDPNHQYLITGGTKPQFIQGSVYNNLIQPGNAADTITAGTGNNEIQDTTANLNGITVTDFHIGDWFDVTDLNSGLVNGLYLDTQTDKLLVGYAGDNGQPVQFQLAGDFTGQGFTAAADGAGGTTISMTSTPSPTGAATISGGQTFSNGLPVQTGPVFFHSDATAVTVSGGASNVTLFGGAGNANSVFFGGSGGNVSLIGGSGTGASTLIGGSGTTQEFSSGSGYTLMVGAQGDTTVQGMTGTGAEQIVTGQSNTVALLNNNADTVLGGSGASSVYGGAGTGPNVYGFIAGHAGGTETIYNLQADDTLVFGGYGSNPIATEAVSQGSDQITLSDGTVIILQGIGHKIFS